MGAFRLPDSHTFLCLPDILETIINRLKVCWSADQQCTLFSCLVPQALTVAYRARSLREFPAMFVIIDGDSEETLKPVSRSAAREYDDLFYFLDLVRFVCICDVEQRGCGGRERD